MYSKNGQKKLMKLSFLFDTLSKWRDLIVMPGNADKKNASVNMTIQILSSSNGDECEYE